MGTRRMQMRMRSKKQPKPLIDQHTMWRTALGTSDVDGCECEVGVNVGTDEVDESSQANDASTHTVAD
jgi:hypothetical protein